MNGEQHSVEVDTRRSLLDLLRADLALTGTQKGCDQGAGRRIRRLPITPDLLF